MAWASDRYFDINSKERTWDIIFIDIWSDKVVTYYVDTKHYWILDIEMTK